MSTHQANQTLLAEISDLMKREHYSVNTERTYCDCIKQFVKFHCLQTCESLFVDAENKVEKFLTYLATERVGVPELVVKLLYGCGFGINEAVSFRVHNIDYGFK